MRRWLILGSAVLLAGCPGRSGDGGSSSKTIVSGTTINNTGACSATIIINGLPEVVHGTGGSTITVGGTSITFSPDCSTATISTASAEALGSGRLPSQ